MAFVGGEMDSTGWKFDVHACRATLVELVNTTGEQKQLHLATAMQWRLNCHTA